MGLSSYCTKRGNNTVNLVTSRKTIARLAHPIGVDLTSLTTPASLIYWNHFQPGIDYA